MTLVLRFIFLGSCSYYYAADTGFYYLQSRYYDPKIGRFINADSLVSTGQGLLGHNMFAYCNNNPIAYCDTSGTACKVAIGSDASILLPTEDVTSGGGTAIAVGVASATIVLVTANPKLKQSASKVMHALSDVYAYAHSLIDYFVSMYENHQPRVHHVIPMGDFSRYGQETMNQLVEMRALLASVGMTVNDPENLIILSHGSHKSLHTKTYINNIYRIMMTAEAGNEASVKWALYLARQYAASLDQYSFGY